VPTYQYACTTCGEQTEAVQRFTDDPLTVCPACGGTLRKVFSPVGIVFKGSGFYRTDSRNGSIPGGDKQSGDKTGADKDKGGKGKDKTAAKSDGSSDSKKSSDSGSSSSSSGTKTSDSQKPAQPAGAGSSS
jgi:putative FmdB family regulatory protein